MVKNAIFTTSKISIDFKSTKFSINKTKKRNLNMNVDGDYLYYYINNKPITYNR